MFVQDMIKVWEHGVRGPHGEKYSFVILNIMGDWPFHQKAFSLKRCFANDSKQATSRQTAKGICHLCLADQENYPWEEFESAEPRWRRTLNPPESPFVRFPSLMQLPHNPLRPATFIGQDIFHTWHLGCGKQFLASCLVLLSETYAGRNIPARFESMSKDLFRWCKLNHEQPYIRKLSRDTVGWPSSADFPSATWSKGSTTTCVLRWFLSACHERSALIESGSILKEAHAAAREIYRFLSKIYREDVWIERTKAVEISTHGFNFLRLHSRCARRAYAGNRALFSFMPNLHRLHHLVYSLWDDAQVSELSLNIMVWNCQPEEDHIGRPSRTSRRVAPQ